MGSPLMLALDRHELVSEASDICHAFGVPLSAVDGRSRQHNTSMARGRLMAMFRAKTALSFPEIGAAFRRDHSTVMTACRDWAPFLGAG